MAHVRKNLNKIVAELPGVQAQIKANAEDRANRIEGILAGHIVTGRLFSSVKVERSFQHKDYWIHVSAPYVVPANYGFKHHWTGKRVEGINFIKGAIYG